MTHISLLHKRSILRLKGEDRSSFLQGLISNDIKLCSQDNPIYAALLTPQGKFLHDLFIVYQNDHYLIDCEAERAGDLMRRLLAFKLRAKIELEDCGSIFDIYAAYRSDQPDIPTEALLIYKDPRHAKAGMRFLTKKNTVMGKQGIEHFRLYDKERLRLGLPEASEDMLIEKSTLLECNMDKCGAISWTKGCYIGQELTARMHHRGLLKKRLYKVSIEGQIPAPGILIEWHNEIIGEMRSGRDHLGLALLQIDKAESAIKDGHTFSCAGAKLKPEVTPLEN